VVGRDGRLCGGKINGARSLPRTGLTASGSRGADFGIVQAQAAYDIPLGIVTFEPRQSELRARWTVRLQ
jgi:hypothetical protein